MSDRLQKLRDKAKQLFRSRNWDKLIPVLTEIIDLETRKGEKARMHTRRGAAYFSKGEYDHAIEDYDEATKLNPDDAGPYTDLGIAYFSKGEHDHAIKNYDKAIKLKPDYAEAYIGLGNAYFCKGEPDHAIENYDRAIKLKPDYAEAYIGLGNAYFCKGEPDHAIENYDRAIKLKPDYAEVYTGLGTVYFDKGEYDHAIENYDKAIKLKPDYANTYHYRGMAYFNKGEHNHAIENHDKAIKLNPDYADAYIDRGIAYFEKGRYDCAIADILKADKIDTTLKLRHPFVYLAVRIYNILKENENEAKAFELYGKLLSTVMTIQDDLFHKSPKDACLESFAHYTSLNVLKSLISQDSENNEGCFRLYNAAYMNDPEEGRVFFKIIKKYGGPKDIKDILYENDEDRSPTYIGSFVKTDKDEEDKDQLFLWRTYGKQDGQEATGSCLIYERICFAERYPSQIGAMQELQVMHLEQQREGVRGLERRQNAKPPLYSVIYYSMKNQKNRKGNGGQGGKIKDLPKKLEEKLKELANALNEIVEFIKKKENAKQKNKLKDLACELLDSIRFLFKASHYSEEHEVRIIYTYYDQQDGEQKLNPIKVDTKQMPPRFYLETPKCFSFDEVILGPMVQRVPEWKRWIQQQKTAVEVQKSKIKYGKIY